MPLECELNQIEWHHDIDRFDVHFILLLLSILGVKVLIQELLSIYVKILMIQHA